MKAVQIHAYGEPDVLVYEETDRPEPETDEVLIEVHGAGVNPLDCKIRSGRMQAIFKYQMPVILGLDLSGVVTAVGTGVSEFQVGQEVYGVAETKRCGAYGEFAIAKKHKIASKPQTLDYIQAASVPVVAMTAWQALFDVAQLSPAQTVLIHAASGSVGMFAVQLAKWKGANVIGTASAHNLDYVSALGADKVIDYKNSKFEDVVSNVDVVIDPVSGETRERSWGIIKPGGILVSLISSSPPSQETAAKMGVRAVGMSMQPQTIMLNNIATLLDEGKLKTVVGKILPLADASQAHHLSEIGSIRGKIVLQVK
ncbi:MAG: NADP-dependent oxidoreductase [Sphaerospermopsis sp. SIO1G2]|nr:NADP-dependent oxidoreductase [Sphaerospermopsis sp. SIO1G2]